MKFYLIYESSKGYKELLFVTTDKQLAIRRSMNFHEEWKNKNFKVYETDEEGWTVNLSPIVVNGIEQ